MRLETIRIRNFRNHVESSLECSRGINVLLGENGEGKTSILEAISYLCLTKSFFGSPDGTVVRIGEQRFELDGKINAERGIDYLVRAAYDCSTGEKTFSINRARAERFSDVIGKFPVVVLSPESGAITAGAPADRRKFMDFVISQSSRRYLEDLLEYRRILKQRNKILLDVKTGRTDNSEMIESWSTALVERGAQIIARRREFVREFLPYVIKAYRALSNTDEEPSMSYAPSVPTGEASPESEIERRFRDELRLRWAEERKCGTTLVGPHRDELELLINGLGLRKYASQGEHKTFLVSLKIAEFFYLRELGGESPLMLLDDVFSELDLHRSAKLLELVQSLGQVFITTTSDTMFPHGFDWNGLNRRFSIHRGTVIHDEARSIVR